jgi:hypothetical protein
MIYNKVNSNIFEKIKPDNYQAYTPELGVYA